MVRIYSIHDKIGNRSTLFVAENDLVAKRNYLLNCCQSPFWSDFDLINTGFVLHDDGLVANYDDSIPTVITITGDEVTDFQKVLALQSQIKQDAFNRVHPQEVSK